MSELAKLGRQMPSGKPLPETAFTRLLRDTITAPQDRRDAPEPGWGATESPIHPVSAAIIKELELKSPTLPTPRIITQADVDALIAKRKEKA